MTAAVTAIVTNVMGECLSDDFAGEDKGITDAQAHKSKSEHRWQPDDQIHQSLLFRPNRFGLQGTSLRAMRIGHGKACAALCAAPEGCAFGIQTDYFPWRDR
jgi:hypothetical protein